MITRRALSGSVLFAAASAERARSAQAQSPTPAGVRRTEVEALRRFAESTHPRGCEAAADSDWRSRWDALAAEADTLSDGGYFVHTRAALGWFKDGHTTPLPFEFIGGVPAQLADGAFGLELPFRVRVFHDGAYVVAAKDEAAVLVGARITRIGAMETGALIRAWARNWPGTESWAHRWSGRAFAPAFLEALGAVRDASEAIVVQVERNQRRLQARLRPRSAAGEGLQDLVRQKAAQEAWSETTGGGNYVRPLPDRRALYVSIDAMEDVEGKTFEQLTRDCFAAMEDVRAGRMVIDLRRNGGGDNFKQEGLRKRILRSSFNRPGGLYVLTSPITFSAAQNCATRLERDSFALFVGEPTGGTPNQYGDAQTFVGEATGIVSIVSTLAWFDSYPQDNRALMMPDIFAPMLFADWAAGRDNALEAALTGTIENPADELDRRSIFFFERPSQLQEWRPFWRAT
ncbi:MAG: hypothetical protein ABL883_02620 [Terricaulis sp.]